MSSLRIEEKFTVAAPPARVWRFLLDPAQVASCLPGARLDGTEGERTFLGTMKVKVGPVTTEFRGKATFVEIDEAARRMRLSGTGDDKAGGGSARMTMEGHVEATPDGGSEITVSADVELAGKLVRFGRGMIEGVSKQLFKTFAERARALVAASVPAEVPPPSSEPAEAPAPPPAAPSEGPASVSAPAAEPSPSLPPTADAVASQPVPSATPAETPAPAPPAAPSTPEAPAASSAPAASPAPAASSVPAEPTVAAAPSAPSAPSAPVAAEPPRPASPPPATRDKDDEVLDAGALIWTVLWDRIKRFFRRLIGRG